MSYIFEHPDIVFGLLLEHILIVSIALLIASAIALPVALFIVSRPRVATPVMGTLGILYTIPSIALIILLLPLFGLNARSVIVALVVYLQIILVRNMVAALQGIDPALLDAARGMGMNAWQQWWRVRLPLALPVTLAGVRIASIVAIGIATVGAKFNAGGLGRLLFEGIAQAGRYDKIWAGALAVGALALAANALLLALERVLDPAERLRRAEKSQPSARLPLNPPTAHPGTIPTIKPG